MTTSKVFWTLRKQEIAGKILDAVIFLIPIISVFVIPNKLEMRNHDDRVFGSGDFCFLLGIILFQAVMSCWAESVIEKRYGYDRTREIFHQSKSRFLPIGGLAQFVVAKKNQGRYSRLE